MTNQSKKPTFFCSNCGTQVPQNAKVCTKCGKFFTFVQCPKCNFVGESKQFTNGCPECGYAVAGSSAFGSLGQKNSSSAVTQKNKKSKKNILSGRKKSSSNTTSDASLPTWIYVVTLAVLVGVVLGFYSCL